MNILYEIWDVLIFSQQLQCKTVSSELDVKVKAISSKALWMKEKIYELSDKIVSLNSYIYIYIYIVYTQERRNRHHAYLKADSQLTLPLFCWKISSILVCIEKNQAHSHASCKSREQSCQKIFKKLLWSFSQSSRISFLAYLNSFKKSMSYDSTRCNY